MTSHMHDYHGAYTVAQYQMACIVSAVSLAFLGIGAWMYQD